MTSAPAPRTVNIDELYHLYYRKGNESPHPIQVVFHHKGPMKAAITRAREHCEKTGKRFILVRPFTIDFEREEKMVAFDLDDQGEQK